MKTRRRYLAVLAAVGALWLVLVLAMPRPVNPLVDPAMGLGAEAPVPAFAARVLRTACFDCHSDETRWPWYARAVPVSWLLARDVEQGRGQMNFSRWSEYNVYDRADMLDAVCEQAQRRAMPLWQYRLLHAEAGLSDDEIVALCAWAHAEAERLVEGGHE